MLPIILIVIYITGLLIWIKTEKKYFPYEKGEYTIEFDGVHEITPEIHADNAMFRSILWPFVLAIILAVLPMLLIKIIYNKL